MSRTEDAIGSAQALIQREFKTLTGREIDPPRRDGPAPETDPPELFE